MLLRCLYKWCTTNIAPPGNSASEENVLTSQRIFGMPSKTLVKLRSWSRDIFFRLFILLMILERNRQLALWLNYVELRQLLDLFIPQPTPTTLLPSSDPALSAVSSPLLNPNKGWYFHQTSMTTKQHKSCVDSVICTFLPETANTFMFCNCCSYVVISWWDLTFSSSQSICDCHLIRKNFLGFK